MKFVFPAILAAVFAASIPLKVNAAPTLKKVLVVNVTLGHHHDTIPLASQILTQLGEKSGAFVVDFVEQPKGPHWEPRPPAPLTANATEEQKAAFQAARQKYEAELPVSQADMAKWNEKLTEAFAKLSPESLKQYDAVIFNSTTGELPLPDREGFLAWIRSGKAFIGLHSASDTFHQWPAYLEMLGGEFDVHGAQLSVDCINADPNHPATRMLGPVFKIPREEIYQFKNYNRANVHELLVLDKRPTIDNPQPGHYPVAWCRKYGEGRVFYTALGHREDILSTDPHVIVNIDSIHKESRTNPVEVSKAVQEHILGGILWALGLQPGDATPQIR